MNKMTDDGNNSAYSENTTAQIHTVNQNSKILQCSHTYVSFFYVVETFVHD